MTTDHYVYLGTALSLRTFDARVAKYISAKLKGLRVDRDDHAQRHAISVHHLHPSSDQFPQLDEQWTTLGRGLFVHSNTVISLDHLHPGVRYAIDFGDDSTTITLQHRKTVTQKLKQLLRPETVEETHAWYAYFLVLYPHLLRLTIDKMCACLHASALRYKETTVAFCGLDGVGKSTKIVQALDQLPDAEFVAENFLLATDQETFGLPLPIRLTRDNIFVDTSPSQHLGNVRTTEAKLELMPNRWSPVAPSIGRLYFLQFGAEFGSRDLSEQEAFSRLLHIEPLVPELQKLNQYLSIACSTSSLTHLNAARSDMLRSIARSAQCIELTTPRGAAQPEVSRFIEGAVA